MFWHIEQQISYLLHDSKARLNIKKHQCNITNLQPKGFDKKENNTLAKYHQHEWYINNVNTLLYMQNMLCLSFQAVLKSSGHYMYSLAATVHSVLWLFKVLLKLKWKRSVINSWYQTPGKSSPKNPGDFSTNLEINKRNTTISLKTTCFLFMNNRWAST